MSRWLFFIRDKLLSDFIARFERIVVFIDIMSLQIHFFKFISVPVLFAFMPGPYSLSLPVCNVHMSTKNENSVCNYNCFSLHKIDNLIAL